MSIEIKKYKGDDKYSWAVFVDGSPVAVGLSRRTAIYHASQLRGENRQAA